MSTSCSALDHVLHPPLRWRGAELAGAPVCSYLHAQRCWEMQEPPAPGCCGWFCSALLHGHPHSLAWELEEPPSCPEELGLVRVAVAPALGAHWVWLCFGSMAPGGKPTRTPFGGMEGGSGGASPAVDSCASLQHGPCSTRGAPGFPAALDPLAPGDFFPSSPGASRLGSSCGRS